MDTANRDINRDLFLVLINDEEQYSIWPGRKAIPKGWKSVGSPASKEECLDYIERTWTDITPRSVREALAASRGNGHGAENQ